VPPTAWSTTDLHRRARRHLLQRRAEVIGGLFKGATTSSGARVYAPFAFDAGLASADWAAWKFQSPATRGKIVMYDGTSDAIFSRENSVAVCEGWGNTDSDPSSFAHLYLVPGMNHCRAGPSTDQFDLLGPLVDWVENGRARGAVVGGVRGPGNPAGANADVPPSWSSARTRPLCPYPGVAPYDGAGDIESAASFVCR